MRRAIPNLISGCRLLLVGPLGALLWLSGWSDFWRRVVIGLFMLTALSDWLDGYLARRFAAQSALGRLLDPAADKLLALVCYLVLGLIGQAAVRSPYFRIPPWLVALVIGKDLWIVVGYAAVRMLGVDIAVRPSIWGKTSTFFQLVLIAAILGSAELKMLRLDFGLNVLMWLTAASTAAAAVNYTVTAVRRLTRVQLVELPERKNSG